MKSSIRVLVLLDRCLNCGTRVRITGVLKGGCISDAVDKPEIVYMVVEFQWSIPQLRGMDDLPQEASCTQHGRRPSS
jgi:hypothetical protein